MLKMLPIINFDAQINKIEKIGSKWKKYIPSFGRENAYI
jgi:hypothetical protein